MDGLHKFKDLGKKLELQSGIDELERAARAEEDDIRVLRDIRRDGATLGKLRSKAEEDRRFGKEHEAKLIEEVKQEVEDRILLVQNGVTTLGQQVSQDSVNPSSKESLSQALRDLNTVRADLGLPAVDAGIAH